MFRDRVEAGRRLGAALSRFQALEPIVVALPRGGVPVAAEVAKALGATLDVVCVRKVGAPMQPELAIGAIADGSSPTVYLDQEIIRTLGLDRSEVDGQLAKAQSELRRREALYGSLRSRAEIPGKTVIVVDDGIATGSTIRAAALRIRALNPLRLVIAVPVAPPHSLVALRPFADLIVCLEEPLRFRAVGEFYQRFDQVSDAEVIECLAQARRKATLSDS